MAQKPRDKDPAGSSPAPIVVRTHCRALPSYELPPGIHITEWLEKERGFWAQFSSIQPNGRAAWKRISSALEGLTRDATTSSPPPHEYVPPGGTAFVPSESYVGRAIADAKVMSPDVAAAMLAVLLEVSVELTTSNAMRGLVAAVLLEHGLNEQASAGFATRIAETEAVSDRTRQLAESTRSQLAMLQDSHRDALRSSEVTVTGLCADLNAQVNGAVASLKKTHDEYHSLMQSQVRDSTSQIEAVGKKAEAAMDSLQRDHAASLQRLERTYEEKLALRAPTKYWRSRRRLHSRAARVWGRYFRIGALSTALGVLLLYIYSEVAYRADTPPVWHFGAGITLLVLALWGLRMVARLIWSNYNLANDAAQKETFVQSYLALLQKHEGSLEGGERSIALTEIFRPASDGYVNDDAFPWGQIERIIKR